MSLKNILDINGKIIEFPIRISQVLQINQYYIVSIKYDYELDVKLDWNSGGKEKWTLLNTSFKDSTLFCYDQSANLVWEFEKSGYVNIELLDNDLKLDKRVEEWVKLNPNKKVFIVHHDKKLIVDVETGEIYDSFIER